ncbi:MAG: CRISPR-associated helicase/endonuclease Cas3 [Candidatus Infernicultor aquiphilus]|uniref:CRISPR-associated helicase/endonuclease Cas3 n=1 Tax=Candidatus Infernicultor aquiphilus TaxID=1805029 RepID=A0A2M7K9J0_9BACT|nr:MAG: CRISPR-associated helicase/endonuclease Cas3 [Candidatus Atribacteria bacterium CG08_land_8_20_14_0_20_33_29]PIW12324.1 MAG: CRISPR-associated helicase/endonuclease Cas3 [Candidatus Atribacteria bacterium CG17_big_fil_post_rev_8_21_14_2_50_34_11]PIX34795.1 MAG: CRISPR-associated helicase/endonuclease Cas3 [Candidatus Atribacteria bacterium CG_4_8_14_3_um_filter_34_18]PIY33116.1 MAG: CRISPR-associated helicase/endonuclease Cas3 [Candidatus Atribacteria bacterium CG_4_10_14_3_um_filter_34_
MEILAKRIDNKTQTLQEHTQEVLIEAIKLLDKDMLAFISKKTGYNQEKLKDLIFYAVYFHDIGKATVQFQNTINFNKRSCHSLYSASIVAGISDFELNEKDWVNLLFLVILTHHSLYTPRLFSAVNGDKKYQYNFYSSEAKEFFNMHKGHYRETFKKECPYVFTYKEIELSELQRDIDDHLKDDIKHIYNKEKLRLLYCYVLGILNISDWIASSKFDKNTPKIRFKSIPTKKYLINSLKESLKPKVFIPMKFQEILSKTKGSVLVEIPTGEGKTEGSYLWGINNLKGINNKIIYTLPTQTTSNKLYERARTIFKDCTGLVHGASRLYLEKIFTNEDGVVTIDLSNELLFSKVFSKPFTVSTIDSLLKYFINVGKYNIAMFNILNSLVIIDEVHSYDYKLMGFIKRFLEFAQAHNISVCIMSASIPSKIKEILGINDYPLIKDNRLFKKKANYIYKVNKSLEEDIDEIIENFNMGKNILIVRNTVKKSAETYKLLKEKGMKEIVLYNANFKKCDRMKKENEIYERLKGETKFILIATQVVEVSLDIDFEILFTDIAPIDSLIQRFGRVNRKKQRGSYGSIFIYSKTDVKPYYDYLLDISFDTIKEGLHEINEYSNWLDIVYDKLFKDIKHKNEFEKLFNEGYQAYEKYMNINEGISKFNDTYELRNIEYSKRDFILKDDYEKNIYKYENTVSLGSWLADRKNGYLLAEKDIDKGKFYDVLNLDYNYEYGVIMPDKNDCERFL